MRKPLVAGNWKMNGSRAINESLIQQLVAGYGFADRIETLICPPAVYLDQVGSLLAGSSIRLGAQNASEQAKGAFTGETSVSMLKDMNVSAVILGHSERRALFGETSTLVAEKCAAALSEGLTPVLCVGETLEEREAEQTLAVVLSQLNAVIEHLGVEKLGQLVVAYEPVWAIGTGKTATPEQAQQVHAAIRSRLAEVDAATAEKMQILYGGSVNASNAAQLFAQADIDGGLVGGASLKADEFLAICAAAAEAN